MDFESRTRVLPECINAIAKHLPLHLSWPRPASVEVYALAPAVETLSVLPLISPSLRRLALCQVTILLVEGRPGTVVLMEKVVRAVMEAAAKLDHPSLEEFKLRCTFGGTAFVEAFTACLIKHGSTITSLMAKFPFDAQVWTFISGLPALQTLDIAPVKFDQPGASDEIIPRIKPLVESQPQLRSLELDLSLREEPSQSHLPYSRIIRDLMGLRNLENLILHITLPLSLTESDVQEMRASWPKMRTLQFDNESYWAGVRRLEIAPQSDLSLLPYFLRGLPCLEELHVPFICNKSLVAPSEGFPGSALRILNVGRCPKPKASLEEVVKYLSVVLLRAVRVENRNVYDPCEGFWDKVAHGLDDLREAA